jgi:glutaredoxin
MLRGKFETILCKYFKDPIGIKCPYCAASKELIDAAQHEIDEVKNPYHPEDAVNDNKLMIEWAHRRVAFESAREAIKKALGGLCTESPTCTISLSSAQKAPLPPQSCKLPQKSSKKKTSKARLLTRRVSEN